MKIKIICERCHSEDVSRDAWAAWSVEDQRWELREAFDMAFCHDCEGETTLKEVAIKEEAA